MIPFNGKQTKTSLKQLLSMNKQNQSSTNKSKQKSKFYIKNNWIKDTTLLSNSLSTTNNQYPCQNNNISYDQFIYTDKLTNNKIRMKDAKTSYQKKRHYRNSTTIQLGKLSHQHTNSNNQQVSQFNPNSSTINKATSTPPNLIKKRQSRLTRHQSNLQMQKQLTNLNQCFLMIKSTQMFKLNSLRQKIFISIDRNNNGQNSSQNQKHACQKKYQENDKSNEFKNLLMKKKKIRNILEESVKEANIKEFRKYFDNKEHKLNHKILSMNRNIPKSFNRNNIQKIISTLQQQGKQKTDQKFCKIIMKQQSGIDTFPGQQKLRTQVIQYMQKQMKQNGQYLIVPQKKKQLFQRLINNSTNNTQKISDIYQRKNKIYTQKQSNSNTNLNNEFQSQIEINISSQQSQKFIKDDCKKRSNKELMRENINFKQKKVKFDNEVIGNSIEEEDFDEQKENQFDYQRNNILRPKNKKDNTCIQLNSQNKFSNANISKQHSLKNSSTNLQFSTTNHPTKFHEHSHFHNPSTRPKQTVLTQFLKQYKFPPSQKDHQISMIRSRFEKNIKLSTKKYNLKQQKFIFLIQNGLIFDVQKQILMNQEYLFLKDKNQDNLLHICSKNHYTEMFQFIIQRYRKISVKKQIISKYGDTILKDKLLQKNKNNRNVLQVAKLYQAQQILSILSKLKQQFNIRQYHEGYQKR